MLQNYPTDKTRERNQIPRGGENCIKTLRPTFHLRYDPEKYSEWTRRNGWRIAGWGNTRMCTLTKTLRKIFEIHIGGYLQRWLSRLCRNADEVYYISDVSLLAGSAGGDTFPSRRRRDQVQRGCEWKWKDSFAPFRIFTSCRDAPTDN